MSKNAATYASPMHYDARMNELVFLVEDAAEGGYTARALGAAIFTEADEFEELAERVREAVDAHFGPDPRPRVIRLHHVRDTLIAV